MQAGTAFYNHHQCAFGQVHVFQGVCLLQHFLCNGHVVQVGVNLFGPFNSEIISGLFQRGGEAKQPGYPGDCGTPVSYTHLDVYKRQG